MRELEIPSNLPLVQQTEKYDLHYNWFKLFNEKLKIITSESLEEVIEISAILFQYMCEVDDVIDTQAQEIFTSNLSHAFEIIHNAWFHSFISENYIFSESNLEILEKIPEASRLCLILPELSKKIVSLCQKHNQPPQMVALIFHSLHKIINANSQTCNFTKMFMEEHSFDKFTELTKDILTPFFETRLLLLEAIGELNSEKRIKFIKDIDRGIPQMLDDLDDLEDDLNSGMLRSPFHIIKAKKEIAAHILLNNKNFHKVLEIEPTKTLAKILEDAGLLDNTLNNKEKLKVILSNTEQENSLSLEDLIQRRIENYEDLEKTIEDSINIEKCIKIVETSNIKTFILNLFASFLKTIDLDDQAVEVLFAPYLTKYQKLVS